MGKKDSFLAGFIVYRVQKAYSFQHLTIYSKMGTGYCMQYLL